MAGFSYNPRRAAPTRPSDSCSSAGSALATGGYSSDDSAGSDMSNGDIAFILLAINPLGGLLFAIPLAMLTLQYPLWLAVVISVPLAYVQVTVVDAAWNQLMRLGWWQRLLERRRSPRIERLTASGGAFWPIVGLTPLVGPWAIMAFMRYAQVPQRRVALPIFLGLTWVAMAIAVACIVVPESIRAMK